MRDIIALSLWSGVGLSLIAVYMTPTIIAARRDHAGTFTLAVLNISLAWTVVGWLALLLWAALGAKSEPLAFTVTINSTGPGDDRRDPPPEPRRPRPEPEVEAANQRARAKA